VVNNPSFKVDKKILGGFVLEFEDRLVDMSDSKKDEEYRTLVDKLERDLLG
jgi:F-type H+-transporting ATPase subunit O